MENTQNKNSEGFKIKGDWAAQSKVLKEQFAQLTDSDLKFESGKDHEVVARVASRLNKKNDEVINILRKGQTEPA